ncbi:Helicase associated domain protein [Streptomyces niveus]|uniref:DEAD/DEAH box helicase n=1 Tax=Streptomyces niveus TaxID=193462 RepID=UPI0035D8CD50
MLKPLREHQSEAVVATVRALELPPGTPMPPTGLRTQAWMATGSGKTLAAVHVAEELGADWVLVLVPSLGLLEQTARAWRDGGRTGRFFGVSSLKSAEAGFPNTTDPDELVALTSGLPRGTVFATYASLGLGFLEAAHTAGLRPWSLIIVDEAHRTSGRLGKPWAVVHDNTRIPAERRLYMTATERVWESAEANDETDLRAIGRRRPELVASMLDDPDGLFGSVAYRLPLETAINRGVVADYQVLVVEVQDPELNSALATAGDGSDEVRGRRIGALQAVTLKAATEEKLRTLLSFHQRVAEAEAFALGLPDKAAELHDENPNYPSKDGVWAQWLCGEHTPGHRQEVLAQHAAGTTDGGVDAALSLVASVKVIGEGTDTRNCEAVLFADVRGSMPDLVQAVGRSLRMQPGEGKIATLIVPVFLGPGETPDDMLSSPAYAGLAKLLTALRAHDARIERLNQPGAPRLRPAAEWEETFGEDTEDDQSNGAEGAVDAGPVSQPAKELLRFSAPRSAKQLAAFVEMRVLNPERVQWRRGIQAATRYADEHQDLRVPYDYRTPSTWSPADFPLGVWIADSRRFYNAEAMDADRVKQLESLGMVWSPFDTAFAEGLAAATKWAAAHEVVGLAAPVDAILDGYPVGLWLKNQRAAARRKAGPDGASALSDERRQALEDIDVSWCPAWPVDWQRCFRLAWSHINTGGTLPDQGDALTVGGEDLGRWVASQRSGFAKLAATQQWMLKSVLGIEAAPAVPAPLNRAQTWARNVSAARQYREREGHLNVPRSHTEEYEGQTVRLGTWISQQRAKAPKLSLERRGDLDALDMRWA